MLFDIFGNLISPSVEKFSETNKENSEYLALVGNLATSGVIKAKDFIKDDGSSVKEIHKLALPNNITVDNNNVELNGQFIVSNGSDNNKKRVFKINNEGDVAINGRLYSSGTDLHLFNKERAGKNEHPGRALVHGGDDTLMINFNGDYKGGTTINSNLVTTGMSQHRGGASVEGRLHFRHSGANGSDDTDPYYLEKVRTAPNNNHLRLTINDDANESFQIWGNSCNAGGCGGPGRQLYNFRADGQMDVNNRLNVPNVDRIGGDWLRVNGAGNSVGQTALYGNLSINDVRNNKGGLAVGSWTSPGRGNTSVTGGVRIGDAAAPWGNRGLHVRNQDGRWTHFNWHGDNKNYIRGHTQIDGNVNTNGNIIAADRIAVSQARNEGGRISIINPNKKVANTTREWSLWNMTGNYGNKLSFWRYNGDGKNAGPLMDLHDAGSVSVNGNMTVTGNKTVNGKIGIGHNNPNQRLEVNGNIATGHRWNNGVNKNPVNVGKPDSNGNFGGGSAYVSFLDTDVDGVNKGTSIAFVPHQWGVASAERMRISANGNVGIGNNNPRTKLDVNGDIRATKLCINDTCIDEDKLKKLIA
ncbi:hypothetical protein [Chlorella virus XW01]|nr:hypothetical protein [Chlorella virus XW01]